MKPTKSRAEAPRNLAVLRAKIEIQNHRIRAGIYPEPTISLGKWQSGPSPETPRAKDKIQNHFKNSQVMRIAKPTGINQNVLTLPPAK